MFSTQKKGSNLWSYTTLRQPVTPVLDKSFRLTKSVKLEVIESRIQSQVNLDSHGSMRTISCELEQDCDVGVLRINNLSLRRCLNLVLECHFLVKDMVYLDG